MRESLTNKKTAAATETRIAELQRDLAYERGRAVELEEDLFYHRDQVAELQAELDRACEMFKRAADRSREEHMKVYEKLLEYEFEAKDPSNRIAFLKGENDELAKAIAEQSELLEDSRAQIEQWIDAFKMEQNANGNWDYAPWMTEQDEWAEKFFELRKQWNKFVPEYNAVVAPKRRNFGRPPGGRKVQPATFHLTSAVTDACALD